MAEINILNNIIMFLDVVSGLNVSPLIFTFICKIVWIMQFMKSPGYVHPLGTEKKEQISYNLGKVTNLSQCLKTQSSLNLCMKKRKGLTT